MKLTRTLRIVGAIALTVTAFGVLWQEGAWIPVLGVALTSLGMALGMRSGIESAPQGNWNRRTTRTQSALITILLLSGFGFPSAVVGAFYGVASAISGLWITLVILVGTFQLIERWFGPARSLKIPEPNEADPGHSRSSTDLEASV